MHPEIRQIYIIIIIDNIIIIMYNRSNGESKQTNEDCEKQPMKKWKWLIDWHEGFAQKHNVELDGGQTRGNFLLKSSLIKVSLDANSQLTQTKTDERPWAEMWWISCCGNPLRYSQTENKGEQGNSYFQQPCVSKVKPGTQDAVIADHNTTAKICPVVYLTTHLEGKYKS